MISGILSFVIDSKTFLHIRPLYKVPLFCCLGVSVTFALIFSLLDFINFFFYACRDDQQSRPLIESTSQIFLILGSSVLMGFLFGFVFGMLDVEDARISHLRVSILRDQSICYPIGTLVGGIAACLNERLRNKIPKYRFEPLDIDDFDAGDGIDL